MTTSGQSAAGFHRLLTFIECPRKYGFRYVLLRVPPQAPMALARGTCLHEGLAAFYEGRDPNEALNAIGPREAWQVPNARTLINAYMAEYAHDRLDVLAVEKEHYVTLAGLPFSRRIDLVFRAKGKAWAMDHKTAYDVTRRLASTRYEAALFTQQIVLEATAKEMYGLEFGGFVLNLLGTVSPPQFSRVALSWPRRMLDEFIPSLQWWTQQSKMLEESGLDPFKWPQSRQCQGQYSLCEFYDLCRIGPDGLYRYAIEEV